ncbi:MAG TPA: FGGY family carbohydrate kinase [Chthoniobacterales bacterium]
MPYHDLALGLDVGTTNLKCLALNSAGTIVAQGTEPTPQAHPRPGWTDFAPGPLWQAAVRAIRSVVSQLECPEAVRGVAVSSLAESVVPIDAQGEPLAPAIAWFDLRTVAEFDWLRDRVGYETLFNLSGLNPDPMFGLCKILWVKNHNPAAFRKVQQWLHLADYIAFRLCGIPATDPSLACRSLAYDLQKGNWANELLEAVGVAPSSFPRVRRSGTPLGLLTPASAAAANLPPGVVVSVGIHDHLAAAFAAGGLARGVLFDSIGTSESLNSLLEKPIFDSRLPAHGLAQGAVWIDKPSYYVTGGLQTAGAAVEWFRQELGGGADVVQLVQEAAVAEGAVPVFLPHLIRSLTPHPDAQAAGAFVGIRATTTRGGMFRAVLEGLAFEARAIADAMVTVAGLPPFQKILTVGGSLQNRLLTQIKADVYASPVEVCSVREATSLGAALLAGLGCGMFAEVADAVGMAVREAIHVRPDAERSKHLRARYRDVYCDLYGQLRTPHHRLHAAEPNS